jgi:membrane protease YdiL (CAAX protease family)
MDGMNARSTTDQEGRRAAWQAIAIFLVLTALFSAVIESLMAMQGSMNRLMGGSIMWSPGLAAILTCLILKRRISSLPWAWGEWRWNWYALTLPIAYGLAMYLPVWLFGLGGTGFPNQETLSDWTSQITGSTDVNMAAVILFVILTGTVGVIGSASRALGEEIGWRGFMIWEMRKVMPFWAIGLLSGFIWGIWHWPGILMTDYNAGEGNLVLQMLLFTVGITADGVTYAYFTFRSKSLWPAVILHASHNLFIQSIYTPLTINGEGTHYYIDEFGIMLPIVSISLAIYFYRRAKAEGIAT